MSFLSVVSVLECNDWFFCHSFSTFIRNKIILFQTRFQFLFLPVGDICPDKTGNFTESKRQISESPLLAQTSARRQGSNSSNNCNYFAQRRQAEITPNTVAARETKIRDRSRCYTKRYKMDGWIKGYLLSCNTLHTLRNNKATIEASCIWLPSALVMTCFRQNRMYSLLEKETC